MATLALKPCVHLKTYSGSGPEYDRLAISGAATLIDGDLVFKVDNTLDVCGADPVAISGVMQSASTATVPGESRLQFARIKPEDTFEMTAYSATASSAVIADSALDARAVYGVVKATVSGVTAWCLDVDDTANVKVILVGRASTSTATDTYPRVYATFISTALTFQ